MAEKIDCNAAMRQLWDFLDGELTDERMAAVRTHLDRCKGCVPYAEFERAFLEALSGCKSRQCAPEGLRRKIFERLREAGYVGR
ncbi:MAG TPA: zf-HC2 domain-containing protein [Gemmatimonadaceae bacterium]